MFWAGIPGGMPEGGASRFLRRGAALPIRSLPAGGAAVHGGRGLPIRGIRRGHAGGAAAHPAKGCTGSTGLGGGSSKGGAAGDVHTESVVGQIAIGGMQTCTTVPVLKQRK